MCPIAKIEARRRRWRQNRIVSIIFAAFVSLLSVSIFPWMPPVSMLGWSLAGNVLWLGWIDILGKRPFETAVLFILVWTGFVLATAWRFAAEGAVAAVIFLVLGESAVLYAGYRIERMFARWERKEESREVPPVSESTP